MEQTFAALCFEGDPNLADRIYWYRCGFSVQAGEEVFAPVGIHDRIQKARVVKLYRGEAPCEGRLLKRIAARALREKGRVLDFGGCRFDDRHYTRFGRILLAEEGFEGSEEFSGFMQFEAPMSEIDAVVNAILQGKCVVLFGKEGKELAGKFLLLLKGDPAYFRGLGYEKDTLSALSERLG